MCEGGDMYDIFDSYMTKTSDEDQNSNSTSDAISSSDEAKCKHFWVAVNEDSKVLGCVGVIMSTYNSSETAIYHSANESGDSLAPHDVCELVRMSVSEDARGLGVGTKLYKVLEDFAREKGMKRIVLSTLEDMLQAVGLYKKLGFRLMMKSDVDMNFYRHAVEEQGLEPEPVVVVHYGLDI
mmetsp:Transcript_37250/g.69396  ORF Transcript_37250/g.69396 Transcript_37250/m.69396 type:complete len:181 (-) Transcript_37250:257-799(-)|eukprot:CAMPEP_0114429124 /NCGR_PEP_ID=MMETSP0103-20121206/9308_1 /TAXON_ID=37642 ORGANISM="Paraphysomonas imperforata, Strain PA2" /NCGR_SAMPLE_ID=MMETSP0103 /ASSEMBLY_ACC=CAM_ASM_000201 /LENGTH=180 /DNA_ID=CAMNT_0001598419 /DNA_START=233 /DNA_END=775 /DNA_ORIENTATION=+